MRAMTSFEADLEALVRTHLDAPKWGDDFVPIQDALNKIANKIASEADCYRFRDETETEFVLRRAW
jgi:hypothetical protein